MRTKSLQDIQCSDRYQSNDLMYAIYLEKEAFLKFLKCYNEQYNFHPYTISIQKSPVKVDFKLKKLRGLSSRKFERTEQFKKLFIQVLNAKYEFETFFNFQKKLQNYENILARLLESYIFIKQSNMNRAKIILLEIVSKDFAHHIFQSKMDYLTLETQIDCFKAILKEIGLYFEGQPEFQNLIYYLSFQSSGQFQKMMMETFKPDFKLTKLRESYDSFSYGRKYPFVWGPIIYEQSSMVEYLKVLENSGLLGGVTESEQLLFYRDLDSIKRKARESVLGAFHKLQKKSSGDYAEFLTIRLMEDDFLYNYLLANDVQFSKILAAKKRSFYRNLLKKRQHIKLAILNLLALGDIQKDYLNVLFEYENNKL